uniref:Zinc finger protein 593 homolog n=1 Tax=Meloidogyne javanica TaxID=6303 RepID=A0A915N5M6_MELJA
MVVKIQDVTLHDVWASNLEEEFASLREFIDDYPYVAMDTEFPGVVITPVGQFYAKDEFNYQQLYCNVNLLKLIQKEGILMENFGELLTTSGLLVNKRITWITFHSCFDFAYLIKAILLEKLPEDENDFFLYHKKLFPTSYDIKMLLRQPAPSTAKLTGGLQEIANQLDVQRIGKRHQAGSDSLLTAQTFFKLRELFFADNWSQRPGKDLDEIKETMERPEKLAKVVNQPVDEDLPGAGQNYCVECDRHFINDKVLKKHKKTKVHKNQLKRLKEQQHSQKDADLAGGLGVEEPVVKKKDGIERNEDGIPYGVPSGCGSCVKIGRRLCMFVKKPVEGVDYVLKK